MAEMTAEEAAEWGKTLDFPTVWAYLIKLGERVDNTTANIDKLGERMNSRDAKTTAHLDELRERMDSRDAKTTAHLDELRERMDSRDAKTTAHLDELRERMDSRDAKTSAYLERMSERVDRVTASTSLTIDKLGEKVDRVTANVGGLNVSMGELIETLFGPHIGEKFDAYQYNLKRTFKRVPIYDDTSRQRGEIDLLLSNTTVCIALEVKRWLDNPAEIDRHIQRMKLIRQYPPAEVKGKTLLGAMAGAVVRAEAREYAEQSGFFVLELSGDNIRLLEPPGYFQPKEW